MPVTDFECQIARGQIGRYLGGGLLSPQAMSGLEEHLAECPGCKALVAERRASLMGQLGGEIPTRAVVSMPVSNENPLVAAVRNRAESLKAAHATTADKPAETVEKAKAAPRYAKTAPAKAKEKTTSADKPKSVMTKPLVLGGLLAVVLIGMSYLTHSNGGKGALGGKAAEVFADVKTPTTFAADALTDKPATPKLSPTTTIPAPTAEKKVEPKPADPATTPATNPDSREAIAKTPNTTKVEAPKPETTKVDQPKVTKPVVKKTEPISKPIIKAAVAVKAPVAKTPAKTPVHHLAKRVVRRPVRKHIVARKPRRVKRKSGSTVRIYGLDGHPLKS